MALKITSLGGVTRLAVDTTTGERGMQILVTAGETIVKGNVLCPLQGGTDGTVYKTPSTGNSNDMPIGVAYTGASAGSTLWMWCVGSLAQVLPESGITAAQGYVMFTSDSEVGVCDQSATGGATSEHWRECGHWAKAGTGNGVITLAYIHYN